MAVIGGISEAVTNESAATVSDAVGATFGCGSSNNEYLVPEGTDAMDALNDWFGTFGTDWEFVYHSGVKRIATV